MASVFINTPRAVRVCECVDTGVSAHAGLLIIELGSRLVITMRPNNKVDLVC